jgi:transposase, IS5 family
MQRRAAVEPVIGHLKDDHRMRRNYLKGRDGDRINAVLAAAGYNFSLLLRWFKELLLSRFLAAQKAVAALQWV